MVVFEVTRFLFFLKSNRREKDRIVTLLSSILGVGVIVTLVWAVANIFGDNLLGMLVFVGLIFVIVKWRFMPEKIKD